MIGSSCLIKIANCELVNTDMSAIELLQLSGLVGLDQHQVSSVANVASLPLAANNTGRFFYITNEDTYRFSDGIEWTTDFSSTAISSIWAWGVNNDGSLGDNTTVNKSSPVSVVGGFTDWCQVSAANHSLGLRTNGTAWAWGSNASGRLGDDTTVSRSSPVSVVGGFTDWCQVSAGNHSLGLRTNGTAWAWGVNNDGRLGDDSVVSKSSPVSVVGGFTDWCQASAYNIHSLAVRAGGTVWAWGGNTNGRLGDNTTVNKSSPVSVVGGFTDWCQVAAGGYHSLAVRTNGTAWAWGGNTTGRLGDGTVVDRSSPVSVVGGFTDWCQMAAGYHSLAVRTNGTAWAWGGNYSGYLGDGTIVDRSSPVSVVGGFTNWCQVSASYYSLGLTTHGTAWAWGSNTNGRLGDGTLVDRSSPVSVVGGFTDWCQVSAGGHSLGIRVTKGF
jgi:alpha-tubulin suppressor-like RCC1 family protein